MASPSDQNQAKLTQGSVAGHLVSQTAPIMLGVGAIMSVGIIDAYYIGQLGPRELAAISFIFPITTALSSLGVGVIAGVSSVVSRALGEGDHHKARGRGNLGVLLGLGVGLLIAALLFLLRRPLFELMQADDELLPLIDAYMRPYALGFPMLLAMMGINGVLRGQGATKRSTAILITFSAANWVLDPVLIHGGLGIQGFGMAGAAYATMIGWGVGLAAAFALLQTSTIAFHPRALRHCRVKPGLVALGRVAGPASFSNSINPIGLAVLTSLLAAEGQAAVAGFGAGGRLQTFAVVPLLGLSSSIGAITGQNWGAHETGRARTALIQAGLFCLGYGLAAALVLFTFRGWFAARFSESREVIEATTLYLEIAVWGYAGYGLLIVANGALNAIDRAGTALALSLGRVLLVMVPFAWAIQPAWGEEAVFAAELACNVAGGLAAIALAAWIFGLRPGSARGALAT